MTIMKLSRASAPVLVVSDSVLRARSAFAPMHTDARGSYSSEVPAAALQGRPVVRRQQ